MIRKPIVALVCGFWGQNIGNAFFNIGGLHILKSSLVGADVRFVQDQPGYRTFNNQMNGNPINDMALLSRLECDYIVLQGPMLTTSFRMLWGSTFKELKRRGVKIVLLSAAMFRYTEEELKINREFLSEIGPSIISTRDQPTYEAFKDLAPYTYSGIDSAFFVPDAYVPFSLNMEPYICVNYDRFPEPLITVSDQLSASIVDKDVSFVALGQRWKLSFPKLLERLAHRGKVQSYFSSLLDFRRLPNRVGGYLVIRPEHRFNPHITFKIYKRPNAMASDEPWSFFNIYANSALTISDRVHACVATLAYGKPAILYRHTKRAFLFDRVGARAIGSEAVTIEPGLLRSEKDRLLAFLSGAWRSLDA